MAQPNPETSIPANSTADILPFKARRQAEEIEPSELSDAECVAFFVHRWHHPGFSEKPLATTINADLTSSEDANPWQARLQGIVDNSKLFEYYDEIHEADPIIRLLDSTLRSTIPDRDRPRTEERKAMRNLMYMRAAEVIEHPGQILKPQLARIPLGDEPMWIGLTERLAREA